MQSKKNFFSICQDFGSHKKMKKNMQLEFTPPPVWNTCKWGSKTNQTVRRTDQELINDATYTIEKSNSHKKNKNTNKKTLGASIYLLESTVFTFSKDDFSSRKYDLGNMMIFKIMPIFGQEIQNGKNDKKSLV